MVCPECAHPLRVASPAEVAVPSDASVARAASPAAPSLPAIPGMPAMPMMPALPSFSGMSVFGFPASGAGGRPSGPTTALAGLGEQVACFVDSGVEFEVGAAGSLFVRLERVPTPQALEVHLRWELEVDGRAITRETNVFWHADDWDQDAQLGLLPERSGELRLLRLSMALLPSGGAKPAVLVTVRDVPISFRVRPAPSTGGAQPNIYNNCKIIGSNVGNDYSVNTPPGPGASTPLHDLARRRLMPIALVPEHKAEWWTKRRVLLRRADSERALLSWVGPSGPRELIVCYQPRSFGLGRNWQTNHFCLVWSPSRADTHLRQLSGTLSRQLFSVDVLPTGVTLRRLADAVFVRKMGGPDPSKYGLQKLTASTVSLAAAEVLHLGGLSGTGHDGLQLKLTPMSSHSYCAILIERLNNRPTLAYLGMVAPTKLGTTGFFEGLPRDLWLECNEGCIELKGSTLQAANSPDVTACSLDLRAYSESDYRD